MAKKNQPNTYPLPEGYDVIDGPLYVPAELVGPYTDLEAYPDYTPLTKVLEMANKIVEIKAETRVKELPQGAPRDLAREEVRKNLLELLDEIFVPLARHNIRLNQVRTGEKNKRDAFAKFQAHLEAHTCSVCGEVSEVMPRRRVPLTSNLSNQAPLLVGNICLDCEIVARVQYAEKVGNEKTGHATRAEKVRKALEGDSFSQ